MSETKPSLVEDMDTEIRRLSAELTRLREVNKGLVEALTNARSWVRFYKDESATACLAQIDAALTKATGAV